MLVRLAGGVYRVCVVVVVFGLFCDGLGVWNVSEAELWAFPVCWPHPLAVSRDRPFVVRSHMGPPGEFQHKRVLQ